MEARLGSGRLMDKAEPAGDHAALPADDAREAMAASSEGAPSAWPDEGMEASMISELRGRGETPTIVPVEAVEENEPKNLPALDTLVKRLSPEVREALDDLFRARFVAVRRVPRKALEK